MYVVWSHIDDKPVQLDKLVLFATYEDAFDNLLHNANHIGCDLVGDWYSIEDVSSHFGDGRTYGEKLRDYYIGASNGYICA